MKDETLMDVPCALPPSSHHDFAREVKVRVDAYFTRNKLSKHANTTMITKTVVLVFLYFGSYGLILSGLLPLPWMWFLCLALGVGMAGIGFAVTHDALHGAYSADPRVNRLLGHVFAALGANPYIWKLTHNHIHHTYPNVHIHHTYPNVQGYDEDLEVSPLIRLSPHAPHKPIHRFQHVFAFFVYSFATLFWVFVKDYRYFLMSDVRGAKVRAGMSRGVVRDGVRLDLSRHVSPQDDLPLRPTARRARDPGRAPAGGECGAAAGDRRAAGGGRPAQGRERPAQDQAERHGEGHWTRACWQEGAAR